MQFRARVFTILVCLGFTLPAFSGEPQWIEIRSPHFSVITDAGERRGRDVAVRFEQMRVVFATLLAKAKVNTPIPLQIVAFRNSKELLQFSPIYKGKATKLAGLFQGGSDRCFIMLDMSVEDPWQVVFHEYAHQLMNGTIDMHLDPWFEEGFAEYFRSITVDGREADIGRIPEDEYYVLDNSGWMKIADLLRVQQNTSTYNENGDHRTVFYAESGMLVHYLYDNSLILKVGDYFDLTANKHLPVEEAIQRAFGMSPSQADKALRNYESSKRFKYYKLPAPAGGDGKTYSSSPLSIIDAQATLADIHLHSPDYQDLARQEFEAVLKADPDHATALRGLGYCYLIKQDYQKAADYFHHSAKLNPNDARVLYYSAMLSQREASGAFHVDDERLNSMQSELERSIQLDPDFADAHSMLSLTYMSQGKLNEAMAAVQKAIELNPRKEEYRFNLAQLYMEQKQLDNAIAVLRTLGTSDNPLIVSRSSEELANIQSYRERLQAEETSDRDMSEQSLVNRSPAPEPEPESPKPVVGAAAEFLHGKLLSVDCSNPPAALLTVLSGSTAWKMRVANTGHVVVIGADQISCDWKNQKVAVNYRESGKGQGDIISLELQ